MTKISAQRLGGMTNRSYKFTFEGETYILRYPGNRTGDFIDRQGEARNMKIVSASGLGPNVVYSDGASGLMVTRFISGAASPAAKDLKRNAVLRRVVGTLKTLHDLGPVLATQFDPFKTIGRYLKYLRSRGGRTPAGFKAALGNALRIKAALRRSPRPPTACHVDPLPDNFLDTGRRIYLLDWEYAGNGDAFFDLAALSLESGFGEDHDKSLLNFYLGRPPGAADLARLGLYKIVCDLLWTPWGAIQMINGNEGIDYWAYAAARSQRAVMAMARPEYREQLRLLEKIKV